jgi:type I restriction enzyme S subunit
LVEHRKGYAFKSSDYRPFGHPIVRVSNCTDRSIDMHGCNFLAPEDVTQYESVMLRHGDVVIATVGSGPSNPNSLVGRAIRVPPEADRALLNQNTVRLRSTGEIDQRFLFYRLRLRDFQDYLIGGAQGSANQASITLGLIFDFLFRLPSPSGQKAIAHILGTLDDKIELNRRMNEMLEAMATAIFKSWFVDFDPVRAKAEGRNPNLPKPIADLFPNRFEESELGKIPRGWQVRTLDDALMELETGGRPKGGVSGYSTGIPSIGAESIVGLGIFNYSKTKYVPQAFFDVMTKGRVQSRDVLLYKDGGRPGEYEPHVAMFGDGFPFNTCAINEHVYRMRAKPTFGQNFLFFWLSSDLVIEEMRIKGTGVAIPGLNSTQVKSLTTLVPICEVMRAFDAIVEPLIARVLADCNESRTLAALRDTLLPKLLSGDILVGDAEKLMETTL